VREKERTGNSRPASAEGRVKQVESLTFNETQRRVGGYVLAAIPYSIRDRLIRIVVVNIVRNFGTLSIGMIGPLMKARKKISRQRLSKGIQSFFEVLA